MRLSLRERLLRYLQKNEGVWIPKGKLADLARAHTKATGENTGRRLRELTEEGKIEVKHVKNHSHYRYVKGTLKKTVQEVEIIEGKAIIRYKEISV